MPYGKFFVIDGCDGSGKTDQTKLLIERMRQEGFLVETIDFPQYDTPTGKIVKAYLTGAFGDPTTIDPKQASVYYADDRLAAWPRMRDWLQAGTNVVANRYVASNMGHQGSKIADYDARLAFWEWEEELEFVKNAIGRPNLNIVLHVPVDVSLQLIAKRAAETGATIDGHENRSHLEAAERTYLELAKSFPGFKVVECATPDGTRILRRGDIHEKIWAIVRPLLAA